MKKALLILTALVMLFALGCAKAPTEPSRPTAITPANNLRTAVAPTWLSVMLCPRDPFR